MVIYACASSCGIGWGGVCPATMGGRRNGKTKTPRYYALNRTKKLNPYILSRQEKKRSKQLKKGIKTKATL